MKNKDFTGMLAVGGQNVALSRFRRGTSAHYDKNPSLSLALFVSSPPTDESDLNHRCFFARTGSAHLPLDSQQALRSAPPFFFALDL